MDGQVVAEFSSLNAVNPRGQPVFEGSAPRTYRDGRADELVLKERLLRNESAYTAGSSEHDNEHFIEDAPPGQQSGVSQLLGPSSTTEERARLLRRLEMCAKAREESTRIMTERFAQRDAVKIENRRERQWLAEKTLQSQRERDERWTRKMQRSPFAVDLVAENQRIDEENRVRDHVEQRRQRLMQRQNRDAHNSIFKRITAENDELERLRREKRMLLENERQLKALRDVERSNARTAQILQERRQQQQRRDLMEMSADQEDSRARGGGSQSARIDRAARGEAVLRSSHQAWATPR